MLTAPSAVAPPPAPPLVAASPELDAPTQIQRAWATFSADDRGRIRRSSLAGAVAGLVPFLLVLWDFAARPMRTSGAHGFGSNFYDLQARALFHGRLSVPTYSFGIEGFVVDGRTYMYFPPFPALLRMPVLLLTDRFDGDLTAPSMLLAWAVLAGATAALLWNVRVVVRGTEPVTKTEATVFGILLAAVTGGSIVVFLAALPWVYHEVYLWAIALAVGTLAGLVATFRRPTAAMALVTAACALGAILTRTTTGWAMVFAMLVGSAAVLLLHRRRASAVAITLAVAAVLVLAAGIAVNWAKFRHPYMFPLEDQVWTQVNVRRRLALAMNDGSLTGLQFFETSFVNYFRPTGIRFVGYFPFVTLPPDPAHSYGGAFVDQMYRTGSVTAFAPMLLALAVWGLATAVRPSRVGGRRGVVALLVPFVGSAAITGGVMFYGYVAYRYTSEFVPVLVFGSVVGVVDIARRLERRRLGVKRVAAVALTAGAVYGAVANGAAGLAVARVTWRGEPLEQFVSWQHSIGGADDLVVRSDSLPPDGPADQLRIVGDCDGLYLATGDQYEPWATVQVRDFDVAVTADRDGARAGVVPLIELDGLKQRRILLETDGQGHARLRLGEGVVFYPSDWVDLEPGQSIAVTVAVDSRLDRFNIGIDGVDAGYLAAAETDGNWQYVVTIPSYGLPSTADQRRAGIELTAVPGPALELCNRLLRDAPDS